MRWMVYVSIYAKPYVMTNWYNILLLLLFQKNMKRRCAISIQAYNKKNITEQLIATDALPIWIFWQFDLGLNIKVKFQVKNKLLDF